MDHEMRAPVAAPTEFGGFQALRRFLAVADGRQVGRRHSEFRTAIAQPDVALGGAALVAKAFSVYTVERHRKNTLEKLKLHGPADLILYAVRKGMVA